MNVPRWLNPATNPALYTALASIALSVWQAVQVDFWRGSLTLPEVGRVAAPIVIAYLSYGFQRSRATPLADPKDGNGNPLPAAVVHVNGDPSKQPAVIKFEGLQLTEADIERINAMLKGPHVPAAHASQDDVTRALVKAQPPDVPPAKPPAGTTP